MTTFFHTISNLSFGALQSDLLTVMLHKYSLSLSFNFLFSMYLLVFFSRCEPSRVTFIKLVTELPLSDAWFGQNEELRHNYLSSACC